MEETNTVQDADLILQKIPSDSGIHRNARKGTLNAPKRILEESLETDKRVIIDEVFPDEFNLKETHQRIRKNTKDLLNHGKPIISVGGDHSVSFEKIKATKEEFEDIKLVWLDSHLDVKEKVNDHISHDVLARELIEQEVFSPEEVYFVGAKRIDHDEKKFVGEKDIKVFKPNEAVEKAKEIDSEVYVSLDIDVLDDSVAPGTGYPDGVMQKQEILEILDSLKFRFGDLVEVAPCLDRENKTLETSRDLLAKMIEEAA